MATRLVANKGNGVCISTRSVYTVQPAPLDVVLVPGAPKPVELPTVNTADLAVAVKVIDSVLVNDKPIVVLASEIPFSHGAPANALHGVRSPPPANNKCTFTSGEPSVLAGGLPVVRHRDATLQDAGNCSGAVKLRDAFTMDGGTMHFAPDMDPKEKEKLVEHMEELAKTPRGKELLDRLNDPAVVGRKEIFLALDETPNAGSYALPLPEGTTDQFMRFKDDNPLTGVQVPGRGASTLVVLATDQATRTGIEPAVILAHELVHAFHNVTGTALAGDVLLPGQTEATNMTELQAMGVGEHSDDYFSESVISHERGNTVTRLSHDGRNSFDYSPKPGSVVAGWRTGANGEPLVYVK